MTTHADFGKTTGALEVTDAFKGEIKGRTIVVTGVSPNGIGESTALAIAACQPGLLILASRNKSKLEEVEAVIRKDHPDAKIRVVLVDFLDNSSIRQAAKEIDRVTNQIHVLINNAGVMFQERIWSKDGFEGQWAANYLGHFLFTNLLMSQLRTAAASSPSGSVRVINVTSYGHYLSPVRFHDYNLEGKDIPDEEKPPHPSAGPAAKADNGYRGFVAYGQSKTAQILFSVVLSERLKKEGILSYSIHPGSIWTGLPRNLDEEGEKAIRATSDFWKNPDQGSATTCVAAFDPALNESNGYFLDNCQYAKAADYALNPKTAERLWKLSEELVGQEFR